MNGLLVIFTAFLAIKCTQEKDWILYTKKEKIGHCQTQKSHLARNTIEDSL